MSENTVTLTKAEYLRLMNQDRFLDALEAAGVNNWEGYEEAQECFQPIKEV
jgi:hypothetical protein